MSYLRPNEFEKKCLTCIYGYTNKQSVFCSCQFHPGPVGGAGTEWVAYCHDFRKDSKPGVKVEVKTIVRVRETA